MAYKKKLIEVALPLPEINDASAYDKMPGIGPHPKGIHQWWARLPLPTARAILFASVVDDPEAHPENWPTEEAQNTERERLFDIVRRMMGKKLHEHPEVYAQARKEMLKHCDGKLPALFDPFSGGGSIPLEANRLGFEAHAGDLNPVAVLLNKCNLELAPRWTGCAPVNSKDRSRIGGKEHWRGTTGLAADVRYYGGIVRERAQAKMGHLYPNVRLPKEHGGGEANVIAWIWTRTVASPNPAAQGKHVPLASSFVLSAKIGHQAWVETVIDPLSRDGWRFSIQTGIPSKDQLSVAKRRTKAGKTENFICSLTRTPIQRSYIQSEGKAERLGMRLMAIVAQGRVGRVYVNPAEDHERVALSVVSSPKVRDARDTLLSGPLPTRAEITGGVCTGYGLNTWGHLFNERQILALLTLSDLLAEILDAIKNDAKGAQLADNASENYARVVVTFLALAIDRCGDFNNSLCRWSASNQKVMNLFARQALPMVFDFAEANILGESVGAWETCCNYVSECIRVIATNRSDASSAKQLDAASEQNSLSNIIVSTDPPYYNNISYATLSDFFYVWLRRSLGHLHPDLFSTVLVPKLPELIAAPNRFDGDALKAKEHFESGFRNSFTTLRNKMDPRFPLTVYYAFKQNDEESDPADAEDEVGVDLTTGWETLLEALIGSGFQITATWPVRASQAWRMVSMGANTLASYIVLACRQRSADAPQTDRRSFITELKRELPIALRYLQQGNIAPVDFAQAAIGPGMAVYSRYGRILESSGKPMSVRGALSLINQTLAEVLSAQEDEFDADTRWALAWFEQSGFAEGEYGVAEILSKAKNTSVSSMVEAGIVASSRGNVRLLRPEELPDDWDPAAAPHLAAWETVHQLIRALGTGEQATAALVAKLGTKADMARELAYRLYSLCERKKRPAEALAYNALVQSWPEIIRLAREGGKTLAEQPELFERG